jgi:transcriptional regulator with XRE-family HTH domain
MMNTKTNAKRKEKSRGEKAAEMIREMLEKGIRYKELTGEIGCSRAIIALWLDGTHEPSEESYDAVSRAYDKFAPWKMRTSRSMIKALIGRKNLTPEQIAELTGATPATVRGWRAGAHFPQSKHRGEIERLYQKVLGLNGNRTRQGAKEG